MSDLISRQAAIDAVAKALGEGSDLLTDTFIDGIREVLSNVPSAERKRGKWEVAIGYDQNKKVMCTECRLMSYEPTPFCPNCGAEMRGEEDE